MKRNRSRTRSDHMIQPYNYLASSGERSTSSSSQSLPVATHSVLPVLAFTRLTNIRTLSQRSMHNRNTCNVGKRLNKLFRVKRVKLSCSMLSFQRLCAVASRAPSIGPLAVRRGGVAAARLLGTGGSEGERKIAALLREKLDPTHLEVQDISGTVPRPLPS